LDDCKTILITDRELFNKRPKEITATKRSYYKEKPEYIESINDIQEGSYEYAEKDNPPGISESYRRDNHVLAAD
jgi:hypothetical protein